MPFFVCLFYFSNAYSWNSHLMTPQMGTPGNCCWGRGGGVVPHGSPNSDPISEQKCHFPHPFSDPEVVAKRNITSLHKTEIMSSLQQKYFLKSISNSHITLSFLFIWKCLTTNQSDAKTLPFGAAHTSPPPPPEETFLRISGVSFK